MNQKNNKEFDPSFLTTFLVQKDIPVLGICKRSFQKAGNCYDAIMNNELNISKQHMLAKSQVLPHGLNNVLLPSCSLHSDILGMVLYGSQARGDATEISDIDVLVVLDNAKKINRTLYSELDCLEGLDPVYALCSPIFQTKKARLDRFG